MAVSADTIYQLIESYESQFPVPAPFVTINVGTFDAATGDFDGLTTTVEKDPEPVDYVEVSYEPIRAPSKDEPRDFRVADVILHITAPTLRVNGAEMPEGIVAFGASHASWFNCQFPAAAGSFSHLLPTLATRSKRLA